MVGIAMHGSEEYAAYSYDFSLTGWVDEPLLMSDYNWRITLDQIAEREYAIGSEAIDSTSMKILMPKEDQSASISPQQNVIAERRHPGAPVIHAHPPEKLEVDSGMNPDPLLLQIEEAFTDFVGMRELKASIYRQASLIKVQMMREAMGLTNLASPSRHMVFYGAPGTGKTTVARIIARIYHELGLLATSNVVEADRSMMVAEYLGQTATKTHELIESALGGVLFIDEAYSLTNREWDDFGREAVETLLKMMEDHRDDLVVIAAGYECEMRGFLQANPGLLSRFSRHLTFPNYNEEELWQILQLLCEKYAYVIAEEQKVRLMLLECFSDAISEQGERFGNARYVRNLFERTIEMQALRLMQSSQHSHEELMELSMQDFLDALHILGKDSLS